MSILIKGMEMPKSCFQCEFRTKIDPDNLMCIISQKTFEDRFYHIEHRDESCPLVPVPEHGRLCNKDDVLKVIDNLIGRIRIGCSLHGVWLPELFSTAEDAAEAWNRRYDPEDIPIEYFEGGLWRR